MASGGPRRRRVPYEWILAAMFVGSFFFRDVELFAFRAMWLLLAAPAAGLSLGVRRETWHPEPRFGFVALSGVLACLPVAGALGAKNTDDWDTRQTISLVVFVLSLAAAAACSLALAAAARRPGTYREVGVFLNAAFLLLFAFAFDAASTPKS